MNSFTDFVLNMHYANNAVQYYMIGYEMSPGDLLTKDSRVKTYHRIIEAFKFGFSKKTKLADPDYEDISEVRLIKRSILGKLI